MFDTIAVHVDQYKQINSSDVTEEDAVFLSLIQKKGIG